MTSLEIKTRATAFRSACLQSNTSISLVLLNAIETFEILNEQPENVLSIADIVTSTAWEIESALISYPHLSQFWYPFLEALEAFDSPRLFIREKIFRLSDSFIHPDFTKVEPVLADDILEDFCSDSERSLRQQIHEVDETKRKIEEVRKENEDLSGHLEALKADWNQAQKELARVTQAEEKLKEDLAEHREHAIRVDKEWKMHTKNIGFIIAWIGQFETGFLPRSDGQLAKQLQEALNFALKNPGVDPLTSIRNVLDGRLNN